MIPPIPELSLALNACAEVLESPKKQCDACGIFAIYLAIPQVALSCSWKVPAQLPKLGLLLAIWSVTFV